MHAAYLSLTHGRNSFPKPETLLSIFMDLSNLIRRFEQYYGFWDANLFILFKIFNCCLGSLFTKLLVLF